MNGSSGFSIPSHELNDLNNGLRQSSSSSKVNKAPHTPLTNARDNAEDSIDLKGKVESRLLSMWNNVKFGWTVKLKTNFSKESPVWLLGRCYHRKLSPTGSLESSTEVGMEATAHQPMEQIYGEGIEGFKSDFNNIGSLHICKTAIQT
uniref:Uncharacterized protein n=1 Tax=Bombyx mori TaxID=7091 RepID=A0A8R2HM14_BOMMO|nr:cysteine protease ATG4C isoform X2 [Bombyx mori]